MINVEELLVISRIILITVLIIAAIAKLINHQSFIDTLIGFGMPHGMHKVIGFLIPWVEISLATLLIFSVTLWWASVATLVLLASFTAMIYYNLIKGKRPSCNCFGIKNKPINKVTLLRNIALIACTLLLVFYSPHYNNPNMAYWLGEIFSVIGAASLLTWLIVAVVVIEAWLILKLFRQNGRLILRIDNLELQLNAVGLRVSPEAIPAQGLEIGTPAPTFSLLNLNGNVVLLDDFLAKKIPIILVFTDPGCGPCTAMVPSLTKWEDELKSEGILVLISRGEIEANKDKFGALHIDYVLLQSDREVAEQYKITATPSALRIGADGLIDSTVALGEVDIASLVHKSKLQHFNGVISNTLLNPS
jgi:peroxiredoxin